MIEVSLLGRFDVKVYGAAVTIPTRTGQSLLAYLILNAGVRFRREYLAGLFWPQSDEPNAKSYLRQALWRLRGAFAEVEPAAAEYFLVDKISIAFDGSLPYWLDADLVKKEPDNNLQERIAATQVYVGELLPGFYSEWVMLEREHLRALFDRRMQQLLDQLQAEHRWDELLEHSERWISHGEHPEPAYRSLILAHAARGDIANALAAYDRCWRALERELGVEPSLETTQLAEQVRSGDLVWTPDTAQAMNGGSLNLTTQSNSETTSGTRHNLPVHPSPFIGRDTELAEIAARLERPELRLLTLIGPGGIGKTRLALKTAEHQVPTYRHGVCIVSLAGIDSAGSIPLSILAALGVGQSKRLSPLEQLQSYLRDKEILLVLDNFEQIREGAERLHDLFQNAPGVKVLVTSRSRLNLSSEWVYLIEGLPYPRSEDAPDIEQFGAVALFTQTAQRVWSGFVAVPQDQASLIRICQLVEGMPLALELAAAWVPVLSLQKIADKIEASLDILEADLQDLPERQRSLRGVFHESWAMMDPQEQRAVQMLSVFRDRFNLEVVEDAFGISMKTFLGLVNHCWVQPKTEGNFHLHELVKQYAQEHLGKDPGFWQEVNESHSRYYCLFLMERDKEWHGSHTGELITEITTHLPDIEAAWNWAVEQGRVDLVGQALEGICRFYENTGRRKDGESASRAAAELIPKPGLVEGFGEVEGQLLRVRALTWQGFFNDDHLISVKLLEEATAILEQTALADHQIISERARLMYITGERIFWNNPQQAWDLFSQSSKLYEELADGPNHAECLIRLGLASWILGQLDRALSYSKQSLEKSLQLGKQMCIIASMDLLAKVYRERGQYEEAENYTRICIESAHERGYVMDEAILLTNLASTLLCAGKFTEAQETGLQSIQRQRPIFETVLTYSSAILSGALLHGGHYEQALEWAQQGLEDGLKTNDQLIGHTWNCLGETQLVMKHFTEAQHSLQESLQLTRSHNQLIIMAFPLANLGYASLALKETRQAHQYLAQSLKEASQIMSFKQALHALPGLALLEAARGNIPGAVELYTLASRYPYIAHSQWFADIAGDEIHALAATLPPGAVEEARQRGLRQDFWEVIQMWLEPGQ